jgi:hypothetical protein
VKAMAERVNVAQRWVDPEDHEVVELIALVPPLGARPSA